MLLAGTFCGCWGCAYVAFWYSGSLAISSSSDEDRAAVGTRLVSCCAAAAAATGSTGSEAGGDADDVDVCDRVVARFGMDSDGWRGDHTQHAHPAASRSERSDGDWVFG